MQKAPPRIVAAEVTCQVPASAGGTMRSRFVPQQLGVVQVVGHAAARVRRQGPDGDSVKLGETAFVVIERDVLARILQKGGRGAQRQFVLG